MAEEKSMRYEVVYRTPRGEVKTTTIHTTSHANAKAAVERLNECACVLSTESKELPQ